MSFKSKLLRFSALSVLVNCLLIQFSAYAQSGREVFELDGDLLKTYRLNDNGSFSIDNHNGNIDIESWDKNEVEISVRERRRSRSGPIEIRINASPTRVSVVTEFPELRRWSWSSSENRGEAHYTIKVPRNVSVFADSHNGRVSLRRVNGEVEIKTHNGRINVDEVKGDTRVESHNGNIEIVTVEGEVYTKTHNGAIMIENAVSNDIYSKTHNGRIFVDFKSDPNGRYDFSSHNGSVDLRMPADSKFDVDIRTKGRNFSSDFKIIDQYGDEYDYYGSRRDRSSSRYNRDRNRTIRINGKVNGGGATLRVSTNNGHVDLKDR